MTLIDVIFHLFIPHESNNHRPKLIHNHILLFYVVFLALFGIGVKLIYRYAPSILGVATNISINDLLEKTNQKRQEAGLPALTLNKNLSVAAYNKASDMFSDNYWAHFGPNGETPWDFIISSGYHYVYAGENLAKDFNDSGGVVDAWMNSTSHRDNILKKDYQDIGFAVVNGKLNGEETTLVVQMFGRTNEPTAKLAENKVDNQVKTLLTVTPVFEASPTPVVPTEIIQPVPTATIVPIVAQISPRKPLEGIYLGSISQSPLISIYALNRVVSLLLLGLVACVMVLDGFMIWKRRAVRISGHNFAHLIFLGAIIVMVWLTAGGSIL